MRKLKLQMQMSVDGFVATGSDDEQKWVTRAWDEIKHHVLALLDSSDTIIIGRKLAVDYIPFWHTVASQPDAPLYEAAQRIVTAQKVVFTKMLDTSEWPDTRLAKGDLPDEVNKLKNQSGKDIMVYGGSSFVAALVEAQLIDEYHLFVNPVAIGTGISIFNTVKEFHRLKLKQSITYDSGIVLLNYTI